MLHFALHRRNFIPLFYAASELFLRPRKIPLRNFSCKCIFVLFCASRDTPLHAAVRGGAPELVALICGACPGVVEKANAEGDAPLHVAAAANSFDCAAALVAHGRANVAARNKHGRTAHDIAKGRKAPANGTDAPRTIREDVVSEDLLMLLRVKRGSR